MKRYFANLLMILIALLIIARGLEYIGLYVYGERVQAHITYTNKSISGRHSNSYNVHYNFTLHDNSLMSGSSKMSLRGGREPSGWFHVKYMPLRPSFNKPDNIMILFSAAVWIIPGLAIIIFSIIKIRKRKKTYQRLDNMTGFAHSGSVLSGIMAFIVLLAVGSALSYFFFIRHYMPSQTKAEIISTQYGNTQGNISNDGIAVRNGSSIYFANFLDDQNLYSVNADGTGLAKLSDDSASYINFYDGWIYYCCFENDSNIYKIKPDGTGRKRVYGWKSKDVSISDGWLFMSNGNDHDRIYRVRINGKEEFKLNNDESSNLSIGGGFIYYTNETDWNKLYKIKTNGTERIKLTDYAVVSVIADEKGVYYTKKDDGLLYKLENNSTEPRLIAEAQVGMPNITEEYIYFADERRNMSVMGLDGSGVKELCPLNSWFISILGDKAMVVDFMESDYNYLIDISTGKYQELK